MSAGLSAMRFDFAGPGRILFGADTIREVPAVARSLGRRALFVTGRTLERSEPLHEALTKSGLDVCRFVVPAEPTTHLVQQGTALAKAEQCDLVVALGGGSVIDAAKAVAAMLTNPGELLDYLEVIGQGKILASPSAPFVAIPTTAGTGAEATRNAVLTSPEHRFKVSLRGPGLFPKLAVVDPMLTLHLPVPLTVSTGLDALTQLIEPFVSCRATPLTDGICREVMMRVAQALPRAAADPTDQSARRDMALGSLCSGLALSNAGLGAVHGFAAPIGGMFTAPHGAVCAALLPHVMEVNIRAAMDCGGTTPLFLHRGRTQAHRSPPRPVALATVQEKRGLVPAVQGCLL